MTNKQISDNSWKNVFEKWPFLKNTSFKQDFEGHIMGKSCWSQWWKLFLKWTLTRFGKPAH